MPFRNLGKLGDTPFKWSKNKYNRCQAAETCEKDTIVVVVCTANITSPAVNHSIVKTLNQQGLQRDVVHLRVWRRQSQDFTSGCDLGRKKYNPV